ncbi:HAD family phosphatase [Facklamia sp. DSM 111018]|uniref:HAD family phosphatase n=1 Tax=Facklamia lactis TaxID=2749967 RepID=A0ABS0LQU6_9LACT|nr:HAD family phosphatase [Facklamia lactis]MBG9980535.1 HAD family phosphatase [Facklamia lactis]MBG9986327.1 HAD family phosphatase [Facklamia lactis]
MIKNFIFDMGNVLILFKPTLFIKRLQLSSEDSLLLEEVIFKSPIWLEMDQGLRNEREACELYQSQLPERLHESMRKLVMEWDQPLIEIEGMVELVAKLKAKGYGIYLLSNASQRQHEYWDRVSASQYFDGTLISADVKMMKPNCEIYDCLFNTFNLNPEECFFIDDSKPNIMAANKMGMKGYCFDNDVDKLREVILSLL